MHRSNDRLKRMNRLKIKGASSPRPSPPSMPQEARGTAFQAATGYLKAPVALTALANHSRGPGVLHTHLLEGQNISLSRAYYRGNRLRQRDS
jgi:hypothetical protein